MGSGSRDRSWGLKGLGAQSHGSGLGLSKVHGLYQPQLTARTIPFATLTSLLLLISSTDSSSVIPT